MPTLLNKNGYKFFFYANEHEPKHIHVIKGEYYAKIDLNKVHIVSGNMKAKDAMRALHIASEYRQLFEEAWDEWFGNR